MGLPGIFNLYLYTLLPAPTPKSREDLFVMDTSEE